MQALLGFRADGQRLRSTFRLARPVLTPSGMRLGMLGGIVLFARSRYRAAR